MIIVWSMDDYFPSIASDARLPDVTAELLRAHRQGNHLLVMDRALASVLSRLGLSDSDKALLARLSSDYTQTGNLPARATTYVSISNSFDDSISVDGHGFVASLGFITKTRILEPTVLLVENLNTDGWLLQHVLEAVARRLRLGRLNMDAQHGGGDDIANVLGAAIPSKKIIVVLVDSDKSAPVSPAPPKLQRLAKAFLAGKWMLGRASHPPCRELENLIPIEVLIEIPSGKACEANQILLKIAEGESQHSVPVADAYCSYIDLKIGCLECSPFHRTGRLD